MSLSERLGLSTVVRNGDSDIPFCTFDDEEIKGRFSEIDLVLSTSADQGTGSLYLTTKSPSRDLKTNQLASRRVVWLSDTKRDVGYCVGYPAVIVHAVSTDPSFHEGHKCIYLQLEPTEEEEELDCSLLLFPKDASQGRVM